MDKSLKTKNKINTIIASKHERPQWLNKEETIEHCNKGIGIWEFASDENPDIVLACAGDTPTLEVMAATTILKEKTNLKQQKELPELNNEPDSSFFYTKIIIETV